MQFEGIFREVVVPALVATAIGAIGSGFAAATEGPVVVTGQILATAILGNAALMRACRYMEKRYKWKASTFHFAMAGTNVIFTTGLLTACVANNILGSLGTAIFGTLSVVVSMREVVKGFDYLNKSGHRHESLKNKQALSSQKEELEAQNEMIGVRELKLQQLELQVKQLALLLASLEEKRAQNQLLTSSLELALQSNEKVD